MRKMISKQTKIRNLLNRVLNGDEKYVKARAKIDAYYGEVRRINRFNDTVSDEVIRHKITQYLDLVEDIRNSLKELPVVEVSPNLNMNRDWAENLVKHLMSFPIKGKELRIQFANIVFAHEKWLDCEINQRNI